MKTMLLALLLHPALSLAQPIVVKSSGGGFTPPEWQRYEVCELHKDKVVITQHYGTENGSMIKMSHEVKITLDSGVDALLVAANKEALERRDNNLCDAPSTTVSAMLATAKPGDKAFTLFETGGCGSDRLERAGAASHALRHMVDLFCPKTYDYTH